MCTVQSEEIKRDPEMDKLAVWAGSGCMAVFPISGSRLISPPGTCLGRGERFGDVPKMSTELHQKGHLGDDGLGMRLLQRLCHRQGQSAHRF